MEMGRGILSNTSSMPPTSITYISLCSFPEIQANKEETFVQAIEQTASIQTQHFPLKTLTPKTQTQKPKLNQLRIQLELQINQRPSKDKNIKIL